MGFIKTYVEYLRYPLVMRYVGTSGCSVILTLLLTVMAAGAETNDGSVLPFPPTPSGSKAARTMQEATYKPHPGAGRGQQGLSDRRGKLAQAAPRGPYQDALHDLALQPRHPQDAGICRTRRGAGKQPRHR